MNATVSTELEYSEIFQYVFMDFLENSLTQPFFEKEKCVLAAMSSSRSDVVTQSVC